MESSIVKNSKEAFHEIALTEILQDLINSIFYSKELNFYGYFYLISYNKMFPKF